MGQKVNPEIFRSKSLNMNWKYKYVENKTSEFSTYFFKSLEIKNFVKQLLKFYGLIFHNCKIALSSTSLHVIVSYYVTDRTCVLLNHQHAKNNISSIYKKIVKKKEKVLSLIKNILKTYHSKCFKTKISVNLKKKKLKKVFKKQLFYFKKKVEFKFLKLKKKLKKQLKEKFKKKIKKMTRVNYFKSCFFRRQLYYVMQLTKKKLKTKRFRSKYIQKTKEKLSVKKYKNIKNVEKISFAKNFIENLSKFVGNSYSLFLTFRNLKINNLKDTYLKKDIKAVKKKLSFKLYKYKKSHFFKMAKRTILIAVKKINSAQFLADYISSQLNRLKKEQHYFLKCIKMILTTLLKKTKSATNLSGIKLIVKGRLKRARRAKKKAFKMIIGRVPLQSLNSNIDYAKATSYTANGTFGTKIWINYFKRTTTVKNQNRNFFQTKIANRFTKKQSKKTIKFKLKNKNNPQNKVISVNNKLQKENNVKYEFLTREQLRQKENAEKLVNLKK